CSAYGGRTASRRAAPRALSKRCVTRSAPTCTSEARPASSGHHTSQRRDDCFLRALRAAFPSSPWRLESCALAEDSTVGLGQTFSSLPACCCVDTSRASTSDCRPPSCLG